MAMATVEPHEAPQSSLTEAVRSKQRYTKDERWVIAEEEKNIQEVVVILVTGDQGEIQISTAWLPSSFIV